MPVYLFSPLVELGARKLACALEPLLTTSGVRMVSVLPIEADEVVESGIAFVLSVLIEEENISLRSSRGFRVGSLLDGMVEISNKLSSGSGTVMLYGYDAEPATFDSDPDEVVGEPVIIRSVGGAFRISCRYLPNTCVRLSFTSKIFSAMS